MNTLAERTGSFPVPVTVRSLALQQVLGVLRWASPPPGQSLRSLLRWWLLALVLLALAARW
jgi:hypothetical protein